MGLEAVWLCEAVVDVGLPGDVVFFHEEGGGGGGGGRKEGVEVVEEGVGDETAGVEDFGGACDLVYDLGGVSVCGEIK